MSLECVTQARLNTGSDKASGQLMRLARKCKAASSGAKLWFWPNSLRLMLASYSAFQDPVPVGAGFIMVRQFRQARSTSMRSTHELFYTASIQSEHEHQAEYALSAPSGTCKASSRAKTSSRCSIVARTRGASNARCGYCNVIS